MPAGKTQERISIHDLTIEPPGDPPRTIERQDADDGSLLRVRLNQPDLLSLGELGRLLQHLQVAIRMGAQAIGYTTPRRSIRITTFEASSLEIAIDVFGWASQAAEATGEVTVAAARRIWEERALTAAVVIFVLERIRAKRHEREATELRHAVQATLERADEPHRLGEEPGRRRMASEAEEEEVRRLSDQSGLPRDEVRKAIRAVEAIDRTDAMIYTAGGGFIRAVHSGETATIADLDDPDSEPPTTPPLPRSRRF